MKRFINTMSIQQKLFLIPAVVVAMVIFSSGWYSAITQTAMAEKGFRDRLFLLAHSSTSMIHSAAEEDAQHLGWKFHRIVIDNNSDLLPIEREAVDAITHNPSLSFIERKFIEHDTAMLAIYVPARIQTECSTCHNESGINIFGSKKIGDLVAVFGVSGSLQELHQQEASTKGLTIIAGLVCVGVIILLIRYLVRRVITTPIGEIVDQSEKIAMGDLRSYETKEVERKLHDDDEIGRLARAYKKMIDSLRVLIHEVGDSANAVSSASTEISSTTEQMAAGSQEQSAQTAEVASAVEEMTSTLTEANANIRKVADGSNNARDEAKHGGDVVNQTITGMKRIADVVNQSAEQVKILGASSDKIGEIIEVIDDIADQTNLLALNAAIEAARAGEQGRGFAVVADEVRKLAERTSKATKEISDMIHKIQVDTHHAVDSMNKGTKEVSKGIELAEQAGSMLHNIVTNAQNISDMVGQIATTSEQQSKTSSQISKNVVAISSVTQESAAGIQQIARTSEDLNKLTENLQKILAKFLLDARRNDASTQSAMNGNHSSTFLHKSNGAQKTVSKNGSLIEV